MLLIACRVRLVCQTTIAQVQSAVECLICFVSVSAMQKSRNKEKKRLFPDTRTETCSGFGQGGATLTSAAVRHSEAQHSARTLDFWSMHRVPL